MTRYSCRILYFALVIILVSNISILAQGDKLKINYNRLGEKVLVVWSGEISRDQVIAIATKKGIVLIDAGKAPSLTKEYRKIIEREFGRNDFRYLINTHFHWDHTGGNQVFSEATIISHQKMIDKLKNWDNNREDFVQRRRTGLMQTWQNQFEKADPNSEEWVDLRDLIAQGKIMLDDYENNYFLKLPAITFTDRMSLDLEDITLNLIYWGEKLHTGDDILIYCPEEKLLCTGDLFWKGWMTFGIVPHFESERWIDILNELLSAGVENALDCHNGGLTPEYLQLYKRYMSDVWSVLSSAADRGLSFSEVLTQYSYENKFTYIAESGLDRSVLLENHKMNLMNTWYCINDARSAVDELLKEIDVNGLGKVWNKYIDMKDDRNNKYYFTENEFVQTGYGFLQANKLEEALLIFKINVDLYPESWNAFDCLGEAYMTVGDKLKAIENYKKSLELNPENNNGKERIRQLENE